MFERLFARRGLSIDRPRVLCEVADAGSIVRAAAAIRHGTVSRMSAQDAMHFPGQTGRCVRLVCGGWQRGA